MRSILGERVTGLTDLEKRLRDLPTEETAELRAVVNRTALTIQARARADTPSEEVAKAIVVRRSRSGLIATVGVWDKTPLQRARLRRKLIQKGKIRGKAPPPVYLLAYWLEFGTRPHSLAAGAKLNPVTGKQRVRRLAAQRAAVAGGAQHPGTPAYRTLTRAFASAVSGALSDFERATRNALEGRGGTTP